MQVRKWLGTRTLLSYQNLFCLIFQSSLIFASLYVVLFSISLSFQLIFFLIYYHVCLLSLCYLFKWFKRVSINWCSYSFELEITELFFYHCQKFSWNFNGLETHRKSLFSLIIVVKISLLVAKSQFSKRKIFQKYQKIENFWEISFLLLRYPNLQLVIF